MTAPAQQDRASLPPFHPHRLLLDIRRLEDGGLVVTSPHLPNWKAIAKGPVQLAATVDAAWQENTIRAYANGKGEPYRAVDTEQTMTPDGQWHDLGDGTWMSPSGSKWREGSQTVQRVIQARRAG